MKKEFEVKIDTDSTTKEDIENGIIRAEVSILNNNIIDNFLSEIISALDYDIWKDYFVEGYAEQPEMIEDSLEELRTIFRNIYKEHYIKNNNKRNS